jgi:outer membrane receptor protein involved in Fe transport
MDGKRDRGAIRGARPRGLHRLGRGWRLCAASIAAASGLCLSSSGRAAQDLVDVPSPIAIEPNRSVDGSAGDRLDIEDIMFGTKTNMTATGSVVTQSPGDGGGSASVGELLEHAPGVSVRRTSAINLDARVRGFHAGQLNASADGMTQLKTRIDIDSLLSQIDPGIVESISVIQGPYSSLYGPGFAFLSADLFPVRRFDDGPEFHGSLNFSHESNGRQIYNRERVWGGGSDWGFAASFGLRTGNDYRPGGDGPDFDVPASYRQQDVFVSLSKDLSCDSRIEFMFLRQDLFNVELPGVAYDIDRSQTDQFNVRYVQQADRNGPEQLVVQFWSHQTPYTVDASHTSKQRTFSRVFAAQPFADYYPAVATGNLLTKLLGDGLSESSGVRALKTIGDADTALLSFGADFRRYEQFYRERDFDGEGTPAFEGNIFGIPRSFQEDVGLLTHLNLPLKDQTTLTAGGRIDWTSSFVDRNDPVAQVLTAFQGEYRPGFAEPNETLGMTYLTAETRPCDWLTLTGGVAFGMRAPNLAELYSDEPFVPVVRFGNSYTDGNSRLDPERNLQFDLGATGKWTHATVGARGFHSTIRDYIQPVPSDYSTFVSTGIAAPDRLHRNYAAFGGDPSDPTINLDADSASLDYRYSNVDLVTLFGTELFGEVNVHPCMSLYGSMAYVRGTNHSPVRFEDETQSLIPLSGDEPLPGIFPLNATLAARLFDRDRRTWTLEFELLVADDQSRVADRFAELPTPGYGVVNVRGAYQLTQNIRLTSAIENLFDRSYFQHGSLAIMNRNGQVEFIKEPGFTWTIGVEVAF